MLEHEQRPNLTILYVEDDSGSRTEVEQLLKRRADKVLIAENGSVGLDLFRQYAPDLVITDIRMPVMDGLQMANKIREINTEIRIIATTAYSDTSYLLEAIETGIDHYVLKPIDIDKFNGVIEKCSRDILAQKALELNRQEREKLIAELQTALEEIKTLQGILPICSYCKDIRNDEGCWEPVDAYITRRIDVDFSHSICPPCLKKNYPEQYEGIMEKINRNNQKNGLEAKTRVNIVPYI